MVLSLSEDFFEVGRFGDSHHSVYKRKLATELGAVCDPGLVRAKDEDLRTELVEWINYFDRIQAILRLSPLLRRRYSD